MTECFLPEYLTCSIVQGFRIPGCEPFQIDSFPFYTVFDSYILIRWEHTQYACTFGSTSSSTDSPQSECWEVVKRSPPSLSPSFSLALLLCFFFSLSLSLPLFFLSFFLIPWLSLSVRLSVTSCASRRIKAAAPPPLVSAEIDRCLLARVTPRRRPQLQEGGGLGRCGKVWEGEDAGRCGSAEQEKRGRPCIRGSSISMIVQLDVSLSQGILIAGDVVPLPVNAPRDWRH